jgi:hypothetical protein
VEALEVISLAGNRCGDEIVVAAGFTADHFTQAHTRPMSGRALLSSRGRAVVGKDALHDRPGGRLYGCAKPDQAAFKHVHGPSPVVQYIGSLATSDLEPFIGQNIKGFNANSTAPAQPGSVAMLVDDHPAQRAREPSPAGLIRPLGQCAKQPKVEDTKKKLLKQILGLMLIHATLAREVQQLGKVLIIKNGTHRIVGISLRWTIKMSV